MEERAPLLQLNQGHEKQRSSALVSGGRPRLRNENGLLPKDLPI